MSITDELRKWGYGFCGDTYDVVTAIADRIDAAHEKAMSEQPCTIDMVPMTDERMAELGLVRLPVDADGEYIHVGDVMERGEAHGRVIALMLSNYPKKWGGGLHWGVQLEGEQAPTALDLTFRHYHEPTVEDVLRDVVTLCHNTWKEGSAFEFYDVDDVMESDNIADFAAKLRLAGDDE